MCFVVVILRVFDGRVGEGGGGESCSHMPNSDISIFETQLTSSLKYTVHKYFLCINKTLVMDIVLFVQFI